MYMCKDAGSDMKMGKYPQSLSLLKQKAYVVFDIPDYFYNLA